MNMVMSLNVGVQLQSVMAGPEQSKNEIVKVQSLVQIFFSNFDYSIKFDYSTCNTV